MGDLLFYTLVGLSYIVLLACSLAAGMALRDWWDDRSLMRDYGKWVDKVEGLCGSEQDDDAEPGKHELVEYLDPVTGEKLDDWRAGCDIRYTDPGSQWPLLPAESYDGDPSPEYLAWRERGRLSWKQTFIPAEPEEVAPTVCGDIEHVADGVRDGLRTASPGPLVTVGEVQLTGLGALDSEYARDVFGLEHECTSECVENPHAEAFDNHISAAEERAERLKNTAQWVIPRHAGIDAGTYYHFNPDLEAQEPHPVDLDEGSKTLDDDIDIETTCWCGDSAHNRPDECGHDEEGE